MKLFLVKNNEIGDISYITVVANNWNESLNLVSHTYNYDMDDLESEIIPNAVVTADIIKPTILI
jgi:hypothetical protein